MYSAEILCVASADKFYTISSHSVRFLPIYHNSHLTLFIFQSLLFLKSFYCSFYTPSDYFDLMSEVPHRFFYFQLTSANWCLQHISSSSPPALPTGTPVAVRCLGHIATELLLYTLVSDFYPWLNFTHMPVQFSEEHLKNATEKYFFLIVFSVYCRWVNRWWERHCLSLQKPLWSAAVLLYSPGCFKVAF